MLTRDDRSLTPPARQGTKEGPTPSLPEGAAPANVAVGSQDATDEGGLRRGVTQAHRIPGDLLPHGPAGPAPVATDCGDARDPPTASPPASTTSATQSSDAALRGRLWQTLTLLLPDCREYAPNPVVGFAPNHEATCSRSALPVLDEGVVGLGRVSIGPGVVFLSALGEPVHFPATDVIRRPLGTLAGGHFDSSFSNAAR